MEGPHLECTVRRFLPETPLLGTTVVTEEVVRVGKSRWYLRWG